MDPDGNETWKIGIQNRMDLAWMTVHEFGGDKILDIQPEHLNPNSLSFTDGVGNTISTVTGTIDYFSGVGNASLAASAIVSGTIDTARLGSGTATSGSFLRGDQTYARPVVSAYYVTGRYYPTPGVTSGGTRSLASGAAAATPYPIYQPVSVDGLQIDLSSATGSGQSIDLHVMTANASGDPNSSVFTVSVTTTGTGTQVLSATTTAVALTPGLYYVVAHNRSANSLTSRSAAAACHIAPMPAASASSANGFSGWLKTPGTGAITSYPAVTAITDNVNQSPLVAMRFA
jgi:hypothetical protein